MMMKKIRGFKVYLNLIVVCSALLIFCSSSFAEQLDSRWKFFCSFSNFNCYFDTKTIEYDPSNQIATVWTTDVNKEGEKEFEWKIKISYKTKEDTTVYYIHHIKLGKETVTSSIPWKEKWDAISPDSRSEALANSVASILHINPIYPGGADRWKWVHSTDQYSLYIAKDTLEYDPLTATYTIWAKQIYLDGFSPYGQFEVDLNGNGDSSTSFSPESDEDYVANAVREMVE
ncbi:hypothetical protein [Acidaminococcus fermentans]|uniref:hypothetical protein n=1 Tax=Acidaminococcus fermentans TaxID=905 RepID=UPI003F89359C